MSERQKATLTGTALLMAFLLGVTVAWYSSPDKVKEVSKTVETDNKAKASDTDKHTHKKTTTTEITKPDGTKETTTSTTEDTDLDRKTTSTDDKSASSDTEKETERSGSKLVILGLAGVSFDSSPTHYGVSISRPLIGPITLGIWGLTPGIAGVGLGLTF